MSASPIQPFDHSAAWKATDFSGKDDLAVDLERRHIEALLTAVARLKINMGDYGAVTPASFPLAAIAEDVAAWRREVRDGRGIVRP